MIIVIFTACASSGYNLGETSNNSENVGNSSGETINVEEHFNNLDLTNTTIIENTPTSDKWQKITFEFPGLDDHSVDRLTKFAENFGITVDKKDLFLSVYEIQEDGTFEVPMTEEAEAILAEYLHYKLNNIEDFPYQCLKYLGDIYIEVQAPTGGMIELDNRKNVSSVLEMDINSYTGSWRPGLIRESYRSIDADDESSTCVLDGKTVKVSDAVKFAENYIQENDTLFPKSFGANATDITLFTYKDGKQALEIDFEYVIDGVVLEQSPSIAIDDENGNRYKVYPVTLRTAMVTDHTIDWIWFPVIDGATEFTSEDVDIAISLDEACKIKAKPRIHF